MKRLAFAALLMLCAATASAQQTGCGKMTQCPQAATPFTGTEQFFMTQTARTVRTTLGNIADYIKGLIPVTPSLGLSVCALASCSGQTTTGTITAGSRVLTLASEIDFLPTCPSGITSQCNLVVGGAGSPPAVGGPTGLTVTTGCGTYSQTPTGNTVSGSPIVTVVNPVQGIAVGMPITGTGIPASTTVAQFNPSAQSIRLSANATATNTGVALTITDPCTATYTYQVAAYDTAGGVAGTLATATLTASGPVYQSTFNPNCLSWTAPVGTTPAGYAIWRSKNSSVYELVGLASVAPPGNTCTSVAGGVYLDGGQAALSRPWWIPALPSGVPLGGQPDWLLATIQSGAGTLQLTLNTAATSAVTNGYVAHDDTTAWGQWFGLLNQGQPGFIPASATLRTRQSGIITHPNVIISGQPGATVRPLGTTPGSVIQFTGGAPGTSLTTAGNFQEGSACLPLALTSGRSVGEYLMVSQSAPGGPSQSLPYNHISQIAALSCAGTTNGVRLVDPAGITYTDASHTANLTVSGAIAATDTVTVAMSGDVTCSATYTVVGGETLTSIARDLSIALSNACPGVFTNTGAVIQAQQGNILTAVAYTPSATHGGGGSEAVTVSAGTGYTITVLPMLEGVGANNLSIDGTDATGGAAGGPALLGVYLNQVAKSRFQNLTLTNFNGGATAFYNTLTYANQIDNIFTVNGSGGTPNILSYSDFWIAGDTRSQIHHVESVSPSSFGVQFDSSTGIQASAVHSANAQYGRGLKFAAVLASQFNEMQSDMGVFDAIAVCCGTYRNQFANIRAAGAYGVNPDGLAFFDAWDRSNTFFNVKAVGSRYDIVLNPSDRNNVFYGVDAGVGGGFGTIYDIGNTNRLFSVNGSALAYSPVDGTQITSAWNSGALGFATAGALTVGANPLITSTTPFTDGAAAATGTLTNAPVAGNPTKWIPIDDNGVTRYLPVWGP